MSPPMTIRDQALLGQAGAGGCVGGSDLETYGATGGYGNTSAVYFVIMRSDATDGTIGQCYNQVAFDANNTTGNIRLGAYSDDGSGDPDALYAETASISQMDDYSWQSLTEFELTTVRTYMAFQKSSDSACREYEDTGSLGFEQWHKSYTYGAFPQPAEWTIYNAAGSLRRQKIGYA